MCKLIIEMYQVYLDPNIIRNKNEDHLELNIQKFCIFKIGINVLKLFCSDQMI